MAQNNTIEKKPAVNQFSGVDDRLLSLNQNDKKKQSLEEEKKEQSEKEAGSYRERRREARLRVKRQQKIAIMKKEIAAHKSSSVRRMFSGLLRSAWINLVPSGGTSIIYVNIHCGLRMLFGDKMFCELGAEWMDVSIPKADRAANKKVSKQVKIVEQFGSGCFTVGCLFEVLIILVILQTLLSVIS